MQQFTFHNSAIIGNAYGVESWDNTAHEQIQELFPEYEIILFKTFEVILGGGGIHRITNDQPALPDLLGDVNQEGEITVLDVDMSVSLILDGVYSSSAELNADDLVNVIDIILLVNLILED